MIKAFDIYIGIGIIRIQPQKCGSIHGVQQVGTLKLLLQYIVVLGKALPTLLLQKRIKYVAHT